MRGHGSNASFFFGFVSWLNESQPILMTKGRCRGRKNMNLRKFRASGQLFFVEPESWLDFAQLFQVNSLLGPLSPGQPLESAVPERNGASAPQWAHIGMERRGRWNVPLRRQERQPRPQCQRPPWRQNAPQHSTASAEVGWESSMTCTFLTARRREGGICWRCLWKNCSGGLMRSIDLRKFEWISWRHENACETSSCHIDRHVLRHPVFWIFFVVFSFSCPCLETHVGMS